MGVLAVATTTASLTSAIGRLAPGEPGGALLQEGADALAEVLALHHHGLEEELEVHGLLEGRPGREVDRALDGPECGGWRGGEPLGQTADRVLQLIGLDHAIHQAERRG